MINKISKTLGTLVLGAGLSFNSYAQNTDKNLPYTYEQVPCISEQEVNHIIFEIPKYFKQKSEGTYLIEFVPEAKKGYSFGGELSVYIPYNNKSVLLIFDRTNINPSKWYNVSNWDSENNGCANFGGYLNSKKVWKNRYAKKFNESVYKIRKIINGK